MSKSIWILIIIAIFFGGIFWTVSKTQIDEMQSDFTFYVKRVANKIVQIDINGIKIEAEVAKTTEQKVKGLAGRNNLLENKGMFFIFSEPGIYEMTMAGMKFPLDAIWILNDKVADLTENIEYPDPTSLKEPIIYKPKFEANYVIEVNQGFISRNGIKLGMPVRMDCASSRT